MRNDIYIRPQKAEKQMQLAYTAHQTVWLQAMAGAGKTAFVRDYMGRKTYEYFSGGDCLKRELVIPEDGKEHIIVIDDMQTVTDGDERAQMYSLLDSFMQRKDIWLILIARCQIPKWLTPLYVEYMFCVITSQELMLTWEQQSSYMEMMDVCLTGRTSQEIWDMAQGHPLLYYLFAMELTTAEAAVGGEAQ